MTTKKKPEQAIMYLADEEQRRVWNAVKASFGAGYSISGLLYKLVQDRYWEIKEGDTKRQVGKKTLAAVEKGVVLVEENVALTKQVLGILCASHQRANELQDTLPSSRGEYERAKAQGCDNAEDAEHR